MGSGQDVCGIFEAPARSFHRNHVGPLGTRTYLGPKHSNFVTIEAREKTFYERNWPLAMPIKPRDLAEAGFFYLGKYNHICTIFLNFTEKILGTGDNTLCFHCNGGLKEWAAEDDPWIEHAAWFPRCNFLIVVKGQEFIDWARRKKFTQRPSPVQPPPTEAQANVVATTAVVKPKNGLHLNEAVKKDESAKSSDSGYGSPTEENRSLVQEVPEQKNDDDNAKHKMEIEEENRKLKDDKLCIICYTRDRGCVFVPCGHLITCVQCAPSFSKCPNCRHEIQSIVKTFL